MLVAKAFSEQAASSKSIRQTEAYSGDDGSPRVRGLLGLKFWQQGRAELLLRLRQLSIRPMSPAIDLVSCVSRVYRAC